MRVFCVFEVIEYDQQEYDFWYQETYTSHEECEKLTCLFVNKELAEKHVMSVNGNVDREYAIEGGWRYQTKRTSKVGWDWQEFVIREIEVGEEL